MNLKKSKKMERISNNHGGPRPNSGRPTNDRNFALHVRISKEANDKINAVGNKSEVIDKLIKEHL